MGANPARQKTLRFEKFLCGEVNRAFSLSEIASGKGINFCRAAKNWGTADAEVVQFAGGENGNFLLEALAKENISARTVRCTAPLRCCTTCIDNASRTATEVIEPSGAADRTECAEFVSLFNASLADADGAAICGTLPDGTDPALYMQIGKLAADRSLPLLLDLYKNAGELFTLPGTILKINREELGKLTECGEIANGLAILFKRYNISAAAITDGAGKAYASDRKQLAVYEIPKLPEIANPIGCGDTASAVLLSEIINDTPVIDAFKLALGAASANAESWIPAEFPPARARQLAGMIRVETTMLE